MRFGRIEDPRAEPALLKLLAAQGKYTRAFAARGLGVIKARAAVAPLKALVQQARTPLEVKVSAIRALGSLGRPGGRCAAGRTRVGSGDRSKRPARSRHARSAP